MNLKSSLVFHERVRYSPQGIDYWVKNNDPMNLVIGDWVVIAADASGLGVKIVASLGYPSVDNKAVVCLDDIDTGEYGWVRSLGECDAKTNGTVVSDSPLMLSIGSTVAILLVAGTARAGVAITNSTGGFSRVFVG